MRAHAVLLASALIVHTATAGSADYPPAWFVNVPADGQYLYGAGFSSKTDEREARQEAVAMGLGTIATAIYSAVRESYEQTSTGGQTTVYDHFTLRTTHELEGAEVRQVERSNSVTYALVRFPRSEVAGARLKYAAARREATKYARDLLAGGPTEPIRFLDLIRAVNLLAPFGGPEYDNARERLVTAAARLDIQARRKGSRILVTPADFPVRIGRRRFAGSLNPTGLDRARDGVYADTETICALISDRGLAQEVARLLERKQAPYDAECVSVSGRLARAAMGALSDLGICVADRSAFRLHADYTATIDRVYSLPMTRIEYSVELYDGSVLFFTGRDLQSLIGDEQAALTNSSDCLLKALKTLLDAQGGL